MQTLTLSGLHCESCVKLATKKLSKLPGVITVHPLDTIGTFKLEVEQAVTESQIQTALDETDYKFVSLE